MRVDYERGVLEVGVNVFKRVWWPIYAHKCSDLHDFFTAGYRSTQTGRPPGERDDGQQSIGRRGGSQDHRGILDRGPGFQTTRERIGILIRTDDDDYRSRSRFYTIRKHFVSIVHVILSSKVLT